MALAIEAAELMEHFQWLTIQQSRELKANPERRQAVAEEMADVGCYLLALANELDVDLSQAIRDKMSKNARNTRSMSTVDVMGLTTFDPQHTSAHDQHQQAAWLRNLRTGADVGVGICCEFRQGVAAVQRQSLAIVDIGQADRERGTRCVLGLQ